jgi:hypothetical protein
VCEHFLLRPGKLQPVGALFRWQHNDLPIMIRLNVTLAELTLVDAAAAQAIAIRAECPDADQVPLLADAQASVAKARDALAARARRAAVLQSLAGLGYEVHEGLATAWVDQGRVVLRKGGPVRLWSGDLRRSGRR